ncbi:MAG: tetratricopeptide repeat protein [Pseudomonadota bacterium]
MSQNDDDRFVREVNEELRRERMQTAWKRFGPLVIGVAVLIVVVVAGNQFYKYWTETTAARNGDAFAAATVQLDEGDGEAGFTALRAIAAEGTDEYKALAQLRLGNAEAKAGNNDAALALFNEVSGAGGVPDFLTDFAILRAGQIMVDTASFEEVSAKLTPISGDGSAYRFSASEAIGLAAFKAENYDEAQRRFEALVSTQGAPRALAQRANIMLELMTSQGLIGADGANEPVASGGIRSGGTDGADTQ